MSYKYESVVAGFGRAMKEALKEEKTGHIHAKLMALYAQDAEETETPWERWEYKEGGSVWKKCGCHLGWSPTCEYRRKPKTTDINGVEVPEPYKGEMKIDQEYWLVDTGARNIPSYFWHDHQLEQHWLKLGLIHLTKEAAEIHRKALLSFTEVKE